MDGLNIFKVKVNGRTAAKDVTEEVYSTGRPSQVTWSTVTFCRPLGTGELATGELTIVIIFIT